MASGRSAIQSNVIAVFMLQQHREWALIASRIATFAAQAAGASFPVDEDKARLHANGARHARRPGVAAFKGVSPVLTRIAEAIPLSSRTSPARWRRSAAKCGQLRAEAVRALLEAREGE
jgi:hypothetical protein